MDLKRNKNLILSIVILAIACIAWAIVECSLPLILNLHSFEILMRLLLRCCMVFFIGLRFMCVCYFGVSFGAFIQEFRFMLRNKKPRD